MKKLLTFLAIVFFVGQAGAQTMELLQKKDFQAEKKKIYEGINASRKQLNEVKKVDAKLAKSIDDITRTIKVSEAQLVVIADSLSKTSVKVNSLKEQVDARKLFSHGSLILMFIIIIILLAIAFLLILIFKMKADKNHQSIIDLYKKTNERLDMETKRLAGDMQINLEAVSSLSAEMSQKFSTALSSLEATNQQFEKQLNEDLSRLELKFSPYGPEIIELKDEHFKATRNLDDKLQILTHETDLLNNSIKALSAKLEEEVRMKRK
ncbi:MAG: hypothetical protein WCK84_10520 [Bacteroidota bacterium]